MIVELNNIYTVYYTVYNINLNRFAITVKSVTFKARCEILYSSVVHEQL